MDDSFIPIEDESENIEIPQFSARVSFLLIFI